MKLEKEGGKIFQLDVRHCFPTGTVGELTLLRASYNEKDFEKLMKLTRYILRNFPMPTTVEISSTIFHSEQKLERKEE